MTLLDKIEDALAPLAADLVTSCVLCGMAVSRGNYGRAGMFCVCRECATSVRAQMPKREQGSMEGIL